MQLSFWPKLGLDLSSAKGILKLIKTQHTQFTPVHTLCRTNIHRKSEEAAGADKQALQYRILYRKLTSIKRPFYQGPD